MAIHFHDNPENKQVVDHIDGDKTNNDMSNLRWATINQNQHNRKMSKNNTSSVKGVCFLKKTKKYEATIYYEGKKIYLGIYDSLQDAKQIRQQKANELYKEFTNIIEKY